MRAALLAPSLILLALQSKQHNVLKEALKWYDRGLSYMRTRLKNLDNIVPDEVEGHFLICAALFMSIYETLQTTVVGGYEQHVIGAVTLLQAKGPELFAKREYHDLFLAVRGHAIHVSLIKGKPTCFANDEWLSTPFTQLPKSLSERINDMLLLIPRYLHELQIELFNTFDELERHNVRKAFMHKIGSVKRDLDEIRRRKSQSLKRVRSRERSVPNSEDDDNPLYHTSYEYTSPIQARIVAMEACARIIIMSIELSSTTRTPPWPCFFPIEDWNNENLTIEVEGASRDIIFASQYLSRFMIGCAYIRMILPLQVVAQMSPNHDQRVTARNILESWYKETPIKGLTTRALQAIDAPSNHRLVSGSLDG
ncbi:hypothetical protein TSTA_062750 [Talaromyces stipitatus ATCC 10500]|uniref:C6 finger domain protein n=1 Tax=Talaromyces stipitatus (strain ATCC 10500 / CBS 375.48 / QM 6759 / NRRL 1006) TaxID=441959 RepID=B8LXX3_TALSN|nr:uncharacterized protein TSTA_062750 [Talaromyces stipitatus ATCC 10500]EED22788.1 hypothetical protein TSTA_062750 [Talaromyces stipitatus ATCC 10500]